MKKNPKKSMKEAFTLIELLVVIAIIGILSTLVIITLNNSRSSARDAKRVSDIKAMANALELYYANNNQYPLSLTIGEPLEANDIIYMNSLPANPLPRNEGGCPDQEYDYQSNGSSYAITTCLATDSGSLSSGGIIISPNRGLKNSGPRIAATAVSSFGSNASLHNATLPTGTEPGDILIVIIRNGASAAPHTYPPDWNNILTTSSHGTKGVYWKIANGTEGSTLQIDTGINTRRFVAISYRITDYDTTDPNPVLITSQGTTLDPPALTTGWGNHPALWITSASSRRSDNDFTNAPDNYKNLIIRKSGGASSSSNHLNIASAHYNSSTNVVDPDIFNFTGLQDTVRSLTIGIKGRPPF